MVGELSFAGEGRTDGANRGRRPGGSKAVLEAADEQIEQSRRRGNLCPAASHSSCGRLLPAIFNPPTHPGAQMERIGGRDLGF